jgi:membrane protease YdiL (CAAX protease family)
MPGTSNTNNSQVTELGGHLNFAEGSYLESTSRPLYALFFLLPLICIYELGTILVNTDEIAHTQSRVAAFTWLMESAQWIGMHRSLAWAFPGFVVVMILLCWQMSSQYSWRIKFRWLGGMLAETTILSLPLFALGALLNSSKSFTVTAVTEGSGYYKALQVVNESVGNEYWANIVTSIGAGIYEELVFRFIVLGVILVAMEDLLKMKSILAVLIAAVVSALLFAAHHYVGIEMGQLYKLEELRIGSFMFRFVAGLYFAVIFRFRGYGIVAGTHSVYNIIYFTLR